MCCVCYTCASVILLHLRKTASTRHNQWFLKTLLSFILSYIAAREPREIRADYHIVSKV